MRRLLAAGGAVLFAAGALSGCGGGGGSSTSTSTSTRTATHAATSTVPPTTTDASANPLTAEANSAAAGDIPDNQVFLAFRNGHQGYSIKYPEGWAQQGSGSRVVFRDKNNIVRITILPGSTVTPALVRADMKRLASTTPSLNAQAPSRMTIGGRPAVKVTYSTVSAPNAVTGKRVKLVVDRYYVAGAGKHAVLDLGTPEGVDNVDAYRLMSESFGWR